MRSHVWVGGIATLGLFVLGTGVVHLLRNDVTANPLLHESVTIILVAGSGLGLLYAAYWPATRAVDPDHHPRILAWMGAATLVLLSVGLLSLYVASRSVTTTEVLESLHVAGSLGVLVGLYVGTLHARTIDTARAAARASARADAAEAEQERLERLNDLLRHYVLNGANVVTGYADHLRDVVPPEEHRALDAIEGSARTMATLVRHVRALPAVSGNVGKDGVTRVDGAVAEAVEKVRARRAVSVDVEGEFPGTEAPEMLGQSVYLLLGAVASLTATDGRVAVECVERTPTVRLAITGRPATLPASIRSSLFEPVGSDTGLDLYLARALLEGDADVEFVSSSDDDLRFELTLSA